MISDYVKVKCTCDYPKCKEIIMIGQRSTKGIDGTHWKKKDFGKELQDRGWFSGKRMPTYCRIHTQEMVDLYLQLQEKARKEKNQ